MPSEIEDWGTVTKVPSTAIAPKADLGLQVLIAEVQDDQWSGTTDIDRATAARAELFSRMRFPESSRGVARKEK